MVLPLSDIKAGDVVTIICVAEQADTKGRLYDLGFTPGTRISCVLKRRQGNIAAYLVRNAVIALRSEDSHFVMVEEENTEKRIEEESEEACL